MSGPAAVAPACRQKKAANRPLRGFDAGSSAAGRQRAGHLEEDLVGRLPLATSASGTPLILRLLEHPGRVGDLPGDRHLQGLLGLLLADLRVARAGPVDDQLDPVGQAVELRKSAIKPRRVPQADQIELDDDQDHVGHLERREIRRLEPLAGIDDDGAEGGPEQAEEPPQVFRDRSWRPPASPRGGARRTARGVARDRSLEQRQVESFEVLKHVGEGVVRDDVEAGVDRAEEEVEIEQDGFLLLGGGQGGRQVDGDGGAADAAGGAGDGDDPWALRRWSSATRCGRGAAA